MNLTNEEKETIILFDETTNPAYVFTYSKSWQKRMESLGCKPILNNGYRGKEYQIDKKRIPMPRAPRKLTPEQRKKLGERLNKNRLIGKKSLTTVKESQGEKKKQYLKKGAKK